MSPEVSLISSRNLIHESNLPYKRDISLQTL